MESTLSFQSISLIWLLLFEWQLALIILIFRCESVLASLFTLCYNFFWLLRSKLARQLHDFAEGLLLTHRIKIRLSFNGDSFASIVESSNSAQCLLHRSLIAETTCRNERNPVAGRYYIDTA